MKKETKKRENKESPRKDEPIVIPYDFEETLERLLNAKPMPKDAKPKSDDKNQKPPI